MMALSVDWRCILTVVICIYIVSMLLVCIGCSVMWLCVSLVDKFAVSVVNRSARCTGITISIKKYNSN